MNDVLHEARATTNRVARTFSLACRLLPRDARDDVYLLYLVFRTLDDLVDGRERDASRRVDAVRAWAAGVPAADTREIAVLERLASRHDLPRAPFCDFCDGMVADLEGRAFETEHDVDRYCYQVAGTVGVVMATVLGTRDPARARPAAAALGMAMQRTNILRDIDEDMANGRVYVALESLDRLGGATALAPGARGPLLRDQIERADALYDRGGAGLPLLRRGRRAIAAAAAMYREILRQIERDGYGDAAGRAIVSTRRKLTVSARGAVLAR